MGITLSAEDMQRAKLAADAQWLGAYDLHQQAAQQLIAVLRHSVYNAAITLLRTADADAAAARMVGTVVGGDGQAWFATPLPDKRVHYRLTDLDDFKATILGLLNELDIGPVDGGAPIRSSSHAALDPYMVHPGDIIVDGEAVLSVTQD